MSDERSQHSVPGKPPYRLAGIPPGIISADDYDVTDEALEALAALPGLVEQYEDVLAELVKYKPQSGGVAYENQAIAAELKRVEEQLQAERREEWREGIVNVLDHEGNYLGCMGSETWAWTLDGGIKRMKEQYKVLKSSEAQAWNKAQFEKDRADTLQQAGVLISEERDGLLEQLEAAQLNITAYREINRWALSTKRCDAPSPQGDLLCDREPGHDGNHVNWQATEWKASGEDHWASREFAKVKEDLKNLPGYVRRAASYPASSLDS